MEGFVDYVGLLQGRDLQEYQEGKFNRLDRREEYIKWLSSARNWRSFNTLTVDVDRLSFDISQESLLKKVKSLFHYMTLDCVGKRYKRICGDYYFSWIISIEPHKSGNLHAHFMADRPINEDLVNRLWNKMSGFCLLKEIDDLEGAVKYATKDICKVDGYIDFWFRRSVFTPYIKPYWWIDEDADNFRGTNSGAASVPQEVVQKELWLNNEK